MSTSAQKRNWGGIAFGFLLMLAGAVAFASGRLGSKYAFSEGPHVRVGAILMFVVGVWYAAQASRKKKAPIQSPAPTRGNGT
jgi:hypothetical protein